MIWLSIFACVLALVAVGFAVAGWITSSHLTRAQALWRTSMHDDLTKRLRTLDVHAKTISERLRELEAKTPTKIAAEVAELSEAVEKLAATHQRFAGRFNAAIQHGHVKTANGHDDVAAADPEIAAMLELQGAPVVKR